MEPLKMHEEKGYQGWSLVHNICNAIALLLLIAKLVFWGFVFIIIKFIVLQLIISQSRRKGGGLVVDILMFITALVYVGVYTWFALQ